MANKRISQLDEVTTVEDADAFVLARSGTSNRISGANLKAAGGGSQPVTAPTDIAGCILWLDASQLALADDAPVATWPDLSANGFDATQADPGSRPVCKTAVQNGLRVVRFDSQGATVPQWLDLTGAGLALLNDLDGATLACAFRMSGDATAGQVFAVLTNAGAARRAYLNLDGASSLISDVVVGASNDDNDDADNVLKSSLGSAAPTTLASAALGVIDLSAPQIAAQSSDPTLDAANGQPPAYTVTAGPFPNTDATAVHIGGANTEPGPAILDGDLMELVVYSRALNARERRELLEYLSAKWATL